MMKHKCIQSIICCFVLLLFMSPIQAKHVLKVLAIGNSFSVDAVEQNLYELAAAAGDSLVIGNAYIGGCSIDRHWSNAQTQKSEYSYRKVIGGVVKTEEHRCLDDIVKDEPWDIITLQQASPLSGDYSSYVHLADLMNYVRRTVVNPAFKFAFHMTWAYARNATHPGFVTYGKNQVKMYQAILQAVHQATADNHIDRVIPSGIAIQRARAVLGDTLNRDGYHLSYTVGRYTAACTWCEFLTGKSVVGNTYRPSSVSTTDAMIAQYAAHQAMETISDTTLVTPKFFIDGAFYEEFPMTAEHQKYYLLSGKDGKILFYCKNVQLPDSDKLYAIPDFKVKNISELLDMINHSNGTHVSNMQDSSSKYTYLINQKIAPFSVLDWKKEKFTNKKTLTRPLVLNFWYIGCGPCIREMPLISTWVDICPNATYLAVTWNKANEIRNIVERRHFRFHQITDDHSLSKMFNVQSTPTTVLVDKQGVIRYIMEGTSQQKRDLLLAQLVKLYKE